MYGLVNICILINSKGVGYLYKFVSTDIDSCYAMLTL